MKNTKTTGLGFDPARAAGWPSRRARALLYHLVNRCALRAPGLRAQAVNWRCLAVAQTTTKKEKSAATLYWQHWPAGARSLQF